jgi:DNA-binding beta-propeller fold protein YncE
MITTRCLLGAALTACIALGAQRFASAHGTSGILTLEAIDARVDARLDETAGKEHRAYVHLSKVLRKPSREAKGMADDVKKLIATLKACSGPLSHDTILAAALAEPEAQADAYLTDQPSDVVVALRRLERAADRARVQAALDRAEGAHVEGVAKRDADDELGMLGSFRTAAARLAKASRLLQALLAQQVRRGSPGQPLEKGPRGTIDTFAGTGAQGFAGDGGSPLDAAFYFPMDVAVEPATGLVHIVDYNNHRIRRIDADGTLHTAVGTGTLGDSTGPALETELHHPGSIAFNPATGDLLIVAWHVPRVKRLIVATSLVEDYVGTGVLGNTGDEGPVQQARFNYPSSVAFDMSGGFYVSDQNNSRIRYVDALDTVHAFAGTGIAGFSGDGGPALEAQFANPDGDVDAPAGRVCLDPEEKFLYVADSSNHRVRRIELATNVITTFAGNGTAGFSGDGGQAQDAMLNLPVDVDCDAAGNVYICDREAHVVRFVDVATGVLSTVAGTGSAGYRGDGTSGTLAALDHPQGIYVDRVRGRLYVADTLNSVIRVVWE